jgi:hypothetical protein
MSINKQTVVSSFERACVSLQRGTGVLVGSSVYCGTAGARIELTPDESGVTAVKVLFSAASAEACRILIEALWEGVLPGQLWKAKADESIKCALEGRTFEEATGGINIELHLHGTEAELVATPLLAEGKS